MLLVAPVALAASLVASLPRPLRPPVDLVDQPPPVFADEPPLAPEGDGAISLSIVLEGDD